MGIIKCVCISTESKAPSKNIHQSGVSNTGLSGDIHCKIGDKQVSMLPYDVVKAYFDEKKEPVKYGNFGENMVIEGIDWSELKPGVKLRCEDVIIEVTRVGTSGEGYEGKKICEPMQKYFVFAKVLHSGILTEDEPIILD